MEYYLANKKNDNAICSNMDEPRDYRANWSKSERDRQIYYVTYTWNLKHGTNKPV